ncbi:MAG: hypothetical protein AAFP03_10605 [Cyanobacteria bacterium J06598_3]
MQQAADTLKFQITQVLIEQGELGALVPNSEVKPFLEEMVYLLWQSADA